MDFLDSMYIIVIKVFFNVEIVVDCFYIIKCCIDVVEEVCLREKCEVIKE